MSTQAKIKVAAVMKALDALDEAPIPRDEYIECLEEIGSRVDISIEAAREDRAAGRPER